MQFNKAPQSLLVALVISLTLQEVPQAQATRVQETNTARVVAHSSVVSRRGTALTFELSDGNTIKVSLVAGEVRVNDREVARYERGGELEAAWQTLVTKASQMDPAEMLGAVKNWKMSGLSESGLRTFDKMMAPFAQLQPAQVAEPVGPAQPLRVAELSLDALNEVLAGQLAGLEQLEAVDLEALRREIREELGVARGVARATARETARLERLVAPQTSAFSQFGTNVASLLAAFVGLGAMGFGLAFFGPRQLEIVADTVRQSFWRSFVTGLVAQPLIFPLLGALILGLILTVIGVLVIPFAIAGFVVATVMAVVAGYLAVARSVGEVYLRRRMAQGLQVGGWLSYRYIVYGLIALLAIWVPAVVFGWVPVAGEIAAVSAVMLTWMIATAGFGAMILSRGGIRGTFTRQLDRAFTDEYLYEPSQETPAMRVPARARRRPR